jgi:hypothetical protein
MYQLLVGTVKLTYVQFKGYKGTVFSMSFPVAYTQGALLYSGQIGTSAAASGGIQLTAAGTPKNIFVITTLPVTSSGATTTQTTMYGFSTAEINAVAFDAVNCVSSASSAANLDGGLMILGT